MKVAVLQVDWHSERALAVGEDAREVAALAQDRRERGADDDPVDLVHDRDQPLPDHVERERVERRRLGGEQWSQRRSSAVMHGTVRGATAHSQLLTVGPESLDPASAWRHDRAESLLDGIGLEILWNRLIAIMNEVDDAIVRTSFSTIVGESRDFGYILTDGAGRSLCQSTLQPAELLRRAADHGEAPAGALPGRDAAARATCSRPTTRGSAPATCPTSSWSARSFGAGA